MRIDQINDIKILNEELLFLVEEVEIMTESMAALLDDSADLNLNIEVVHKNTTTNVVTEVPGHLIINSHEFNKFIQEIRQSRLPKIEYISIPSNFYGSIMQQLVDHKKARISEIWTELESVFIQEKQKHGRSKSKA